jgi:hypothetical protein
MQKWRRESVLDLYNLLLATSLLAFMWFSVHGSRTATVEDLWATGFAIAIVSLASIVAHARWEEWINFLLGIWLIISPWALGFTHTRAMHFSIGIGIAVTFLAALELWLEYDASGTDTSPSGTSGQH